MVYAQLPLQFEYHADQIFATFFSGRNQEIVTHLKACVDNIGERFVLIWGAKGQGKSHLLLACCQRAFEHSSQAFYLSLHPKKPSPKILNDLEKMSLVCIDDIDKLVGDEHWELALFNFFNRMCVHNKSLIIASKYPPAQLPIQLPDLKTRLGGGLTMSLRKLNEPEMIVALQLKAKNMGFEFTDKVGYFLLTHYSRDVAVLWNLLPLLDQATLATQRKITIPFLKQLLNL